MLTTTPTLQKRLPAIVTEPAQDDYTLRYIIRYRQNWRKLQPEQQAAILRAAADYLETEIAGMRERADAMLVSTR